ncbi:MAG: polysaccharide deacetylase family protein [Anaerolineae bacterium]|nr:polysaccharide deacetylase family protein [Anaerolineae bacterium]
MRYLLPLFILVTVLGSSVNAQTPSSESLAPQWDGTLRRIRVPILMYHYVSELPAQADDIRIGLTVTPPLFRAHLAYLKEQGYTTISLYDLDNALLRGIPLPPKPVILTFDDGYIDHYIHVFPALQEYGFTGTFFIITGLADEKAQGYMTWEQIQTMAAAGMSMESHTKTHADLRDRDYEFLVYELLGSLESLAALNGHKSHMFAYPVGRYDDATLSVLEQLPVWRAVTTQPGLLHTTDNHLELPRQRVTGNMSVSGLEYILLNG